MITPITDAILYINLIYFSFCIVMVAIHAGINIDRLMTSLDKLNAVS